MNELARALSQSIAAEPLAGLAGIYGTATGGSGEGVRLIDKVREKVGYQPQTKEGIRNLDALARALSPVNNALEKARTTLGDGAFNATGSPALAAAAYTAPDAILSALGARPAMAAGRSAQAGIGRAVRRATELPSPTMGSPASQIGAIRAYHGTPHDFDRFSMDKIGTGEGAQAYGHGLYFAGKPEVAEGYRDSLSTMAVHNSRVEQIDRFLELMPGVDSRDAVIAAQAAFRAIDSDGLATPDSVTRHIRRMAGEPRPGAEQIAQQAADYVSQNAPASNRGRFYEVELAPDEADLLDWDAPLSEQSEKVRAALAAGDRTIEGGVIGNRYPLLSPETNAAPFNNGEEVYKGLARALARRAGEQDIWRGSTPMGNQGVMASEYLKSLGIPGIRYLDGGSRAAGDGSRNYVMFDDSLIKILGKK